MSRRALPIPSRSNAAIIVGQLVAIAACVNAARGPLAGEHLEHGLRDRSAVPRQCGVLVEHGASSASGTGP